MWSFDPEGSDGTIAHPPEVLSALKVSDLAKLRWLQRPQPVFSGATPIALPRGRAAWWMCSGNPGRGLRFDGPFSRFDHDEPGQRSGIHYSAFSLSGGVVEVRGDTNIVDIRGCRLARIQMSRPLPPLNLRRSGAMCRAGSVPGLAAHGIATCRRLYTDGPTTPSAACGICPDHALVML